MLNKFLCGLVLFCLLGTSYYIGTQNSTNPAPPPKKDVVEAYEPSAAEDIVIDKDKEYLLIDDIVLTMPKELKKGGQFELTLTKQEGRTRIETHIKKTVLE